MFVRVLFYKFCSSAKNTYVRPSGYARSFIRLGYDAAHWVMESHVSKKTNAVRTFWRVEHSSNIANTGHIEGHAVAQLVEALRYKAEGRGFYSRWCH